jgi:hypothetical protein
VVLLLVLLTLTGHFRRVSLQFHVLLEADPFLNKLTKLYERNKTVGVGLGHRETL